MLVGHSGTRVDEMKRVKMVKKNFMYSKKIMINGHHKRQNITKTKEKFK